MKKSTKYLLGGAGVVVFLYLLWLAVRKKPAVDGWSGEGEVIVPGDPDGPPASAVKITPLAETPAMSGGAFKWKPTNLATTLSASALKAGY